MDFPQPEQQNARVIRLAMRVVSLPVTLVRAAYAGFVGFVQWLKSAKRRRSDDRVRQSQVRRVLRGLSPDHVQK
jgi:hypothetical protein